MSSGYLIKDTDGQIAGYALLQEQRLFLRMNKCEGKVLVTVGDGEVEKSFSVLCDAGEHVFEWRQGKIEWIRYEHDVTNNKQAADDTYREETQKKEFRNPEKSCKKRFIRGVYKGRNNAARCECMLRWPPPPCWPTAHYANGIWQEGGE